MILSLKIGVKYCVVHPYNMNLKGWIYAHVIYMDSPFSLCMDKLFHYPLGGPIVGSTMEYLRLYIHIDYLGTTYMYFELVE